jgi:hypothetical protein
MEWKSALYEKKKKSLSLEDPTKDVTTQNLMSG